MDRTLFGCRTSTEWLRFFFSLSLSLILLTPVYSSAHGFAGKRFFPTTFQVDDPFISDEFSVLINRIKQPGDEPNKLTQIDIDYSKRILPNFGLEFHEAYLHLGSDDGSANGWDNLGVGAKWQFLTNEEHELILSDRHGYRYWRNRSAPGVGILFDHYSGLLLRKGLRRPA